jgi:hypothetical protein
MVRRFHREAPLKRIAACLVLVALPAAALAQAVTATAPIAAAPRWKLVQAADGCWAETGSGLVFAEGDTVHAKLLINKEGGLILIASHPGWQRTESRIDFTVRPDSGEPIPISGSAAVVMAMGPIKRDDDAARLRNAQMLVWNLPWGNYRAQVQGLGKALDAIAACERKRRAAPAPRPRP